MATTPAKSQQQGSVSEVFSFDKGMNRKKARLLLEQGELYSCSGFGYANDGVLTARTAKNVVATLPSDYLDITGTTRTGDVDILLDACNAVGSWTNDSSVPESVDITLDTDNSLKMTLAKYPKVYYYEDGTDDFGVGDAAGALYHCQGFKLSANADIKAIGLKVYRSADPGGTLSDLTVSIYNTNNVLGDGKPTTLIDSATIAKADVPVGAYDAAQNDYKYAIFSTPVSLTAGTIYSIVIYATDPFVQIYTIQGYNGLVNQFGAGGEVVWRGVALDLLVESATADTNFRACILGDLLNHYIYTTISSTDIGIQTSLVTNIKSSKSGSLLSHSVGESAIGEQNVAFSITATNTWEWTSSSIESIADTSLDGITKVGFKITNADDNVVVLNVAYYVARRTVTECPTFDRTSIPRVMNQIHRYGDDIYANVKAICPGVQSYFNYRYHRDINDSAYTYLHFSSSDTMPRFADYEKFCFAVDGETKKAYIAENVYEWGVANPITAPTVSLGAAGNPNGTYNCYYTFYIEYPNGKVVETGPSSSTEITATNQIISWDTVPVCPYEGNELIISRRLYRTVSGVAYLVDVINDNVTTSYATDNVSDANLQGATVLPSEGYTVPPDHITDIVVYLQRVFAIATNTLYWPEAYKPHSFVDTSSLVVSKEDENLVSLIDWGDQLYMSTAGRWFRLQGVDPDTWAIKRTFSDNGLIDCHTQEKTKWGIIGRWYDGIYNFDGVLSKNITDKKLGREFFLNIVDPSTCYSEYDGTRYYFYYDSSCIVIDFTYAPDYRIYQDDFVANAHHFYREAGTNHYGKGSSEYGNTGTETIATSVVTGDKAFGSIGKRKVLEYLYYDANTDGKNLTVNIVMDGTLADSIVINSVERTRKRSRPLKAIEGYRASLELSCADSQYLEIYSPWILEATPVGE